MLKVLIASSECVPFSKTGGLADVAGAIPKALVKKGVDARVITPLYKSMPEKYRLKLEHVIFFYINLGWRRQYVGIERLVIDNVTYYFVDNEFYFGRSYIYGIGGDEDERFGYFCRAILEAMPLIDFIPDVLHLNDWQTGLASALLESQYRVLPLYKNIKTVYTIHNLQYQGIFPTYRIEELLSLGADMYTTDKLEFYGQCSCMKAGIAFSDAITTVSPTYASEIQTPYYGEKLDGLLRSRADRLVGILNGIDTDVYDPTTDEMISRNYGADTLNLKVENKLALQRELGLTEGADIPMIAIISRLSGQKGIDLVDRVLSEIMATGAQLVILGMGEERYVDLFGWAQWKYSGMLAARFEMNHSLAHSIYAACDMFLMPSLFEPCGLSQMIALRYGALPIARETGGLRDTVLSFNEYTGEGNGFTFLNYNAHDMLSVVRRAVDYYVNHREVWNKIVRRAMQVNYGWDRSADEYIRLYSNLHEGKSITSGRAAAKSKAENEVKAESDAIAKAEAKAERAAEKAQVEAEIAAEKAERAEANAQAESERAAIYASDEAVKEEPVKKPARKPSAKKAEPKAATEQPKPRARKTADKTSDAPAPKPSRRKKAAAENTADK